MAVTKGGSKATYKVINVITTVLVVLIAAFAAMLVIPKVTGVEAYVVMSGSMEPAYKTGSLIYTAENIDCDELETGDVITFRLNDSTVATHRIVGISTHSDTLMFQTKGDANNVPDPNPVPEQNVIGKVICGIPYLGYAADFVQHPPGIYLAAVLGALLLLFGFVSDRRRGRKA